MDPIRTIDTNLAFIGQSNALLAGELTKLPEIRTIRNRGTRLAMDNLLALYRMSPDRFDQMFRHMNRIGLPDNRKYCTPLQAFFWAVEDEKMNASGDLLGLDVERTFDNQGRCRPRLNDTAKPPDKRLGTGCATSAPCLDNVLDAAWNGESRLLGDRTIRDIVHGIQTDDAAQDYAMLVRKRTSRQIQGYIMDDYLQTPSIFAARDWSTIESAINQSRWKQFFTVADRLNAPELVSYYINKYFYFRKTPASGVYFTFFEKSAQCTDAAYFAQFMLARAGYRTFIRSVKWDPDPWDGLHTGAGIVLDDGSYLLVANYTGINAISGPFADTAALDRKLSCRHSIIHSQWGAYYPPRHY